jgi:hypothetical protein
MRLDAKQKALIAEVTSQLMQSSNYQHRLKAADDELYEMHDGKGGVEGTTTDNEEDGYEWDDNIDDEELRIPAKEGQKGNQDAIREPKGR